MSEHVITPRTYTIVFAALLVLLVLTVVAATFDFGPLNLAIALAIATAKAALIVVYFMHLRFAPALVRVIAAAGLLWAAFATALTLGDYLTRGWHEMPTPVAEPDVIDRYLMGGDLESSPAVDEPVAPDA